jgi:hypothetical protein
MKKRLAYRFLLFSLIAVLVGSLIYSQLSRDPDKPKPNWPLLALAANSANNIEFEIGVNVRVSGDDNPSPYWECINACDPENSETIHAAAMVMHPGGRNAIAVFLSEDGGESWASCGSWNAKENRCLNDPTLAVGSNSTAYLAFMDVDRNQQESGELVILEWTPDTRKWNERIRYNGYVDRPWLAVNVNSGTVTSVYCLGQRAKQEDGQLAEPILLSSIDNLQKLTIHRPHSGRPMINCRPANPVVLDSGELFIAYMDRYLNRTIKTWPRPVIYTCIGDKECKTFDARAPVNTRWWSNTFQSGANGCFFPKLAMDRSDTSRGRIYCVWDDGDLARNQTGVFLSMSDNRGETWSLPVLLSEQPLTESASFISTRPAVSVNRDGVVAVAWYDRRGLPAVELVPMDGNQGVMKQVVSGWSIRIRMSFDGGETWTPSEKLNTAPATGEFFVGHTLGLDAGKDGKFHATWVDDRSGENEIWHASVVIQ